MTGALLPIFPGAGFESSLLTAVLIGLLVTLLLHETIGWGFNGLVVPATSPAFSWCGPPPA